MKRRPPCHKPRRTWIVLPLTLLGCSTLDRSHETFAPVVLAPPRPAFVRVTIAQAGFGSAVAYRLCPVDSCPQPTHKTLAGPAQMRQPATVERDEPTRPSPTPVAAHQAKPAEVMQVNVPFALGSATLNANGRAILDRVVIAATAAGAIEVRGRTDDRGSTDANTTLARQRAHAVRDYLSPRLTDRAQLHVTFEGACCYVASNHTAAGRAVNRRVEVEWRTALDPTAMPTPDEEKPWSSRRNT